MTWIADLKGLIDSELRNVNVAIPGKVESYDFAKGTVDVLPLIKRARVDHDGDRVVTPLPVIPGVHVVFSGMTFPIERGDTVLLVFSQASLDKWGVNGRLVDPEDDRHHDITDAFAIPGVYSIGRPPDARVQGETVIPGDIRLGSTGGDYVSLKKDLDKLLNVFQNWLPVAGSADGGTLLKTALTAAYAPLLWKSEGATKVKAE